MSAIFIAKPVNLVYNLYKFFVREVIYAKLKF